MMYFLCHCTDCQIMFNGSFECYAISRDELSLEGVLSTDTYSGGSGQSIHVNFFCKTCSTKTLTQTDILDGIIYVPARLPRDQLEFKLKGEIWTGLRPSWTNKRECLVESYTENGTI